MSNEIQLTDLERAECYRLRANVQNFIGFIQKRDPKQILKRININFEKNIVTVTYKIRETEVTC